ncbi:TSUP family transporter, partial [Acinetobacter baumannii]
KNSKPRPLVGFGLQLLVAVYGGYFGAGMGMMMLGAFALTMDADIHAMTAVKNGLGTIINVVAAIYFLGSGVVQVPIALTLAVGSAVGGFV